MVLFDDHYRDELMPLVLTKPCAMLRVGILPIAEKWQLMFPEETLSFSTDHYLQSKFGEPAHGEQLWINGRFLPTNQLSDQIRNLKSGEALVKEQTLVAALTSFTDAGFIMERCKLSSIDYEVVEIAHPWDIYHHNGAAIQRDWDLMGLEPKMNKSSEGGISVYGEDIFIHPEAKVRGASLNSETGPIYIGRNAEIMEGSCVRGPFVLGESATLKMGTKIYGATTIGPYSKVGGEVSNSVIMGYTNKGHDGFIGNSVIGEWCNLGADTNCSNLKNNYGSVRVWNYRLEKMVDTGLQFCGLIMGDHSKTGINTMLNTGTVVGVAANIFGGGFPDKFIPSFSWGGAHGFETFELDKAFEVAERMMDRRGVKFTDADREILRHIYSFSEKYR